MGGGGGSGVGEMGARLVWEKVGRAIGMED